jgi:uncharacterized repeat protein (TIGR01451 family)
MIEGVVASGSRERFGVYLGGVNPSSPVLEILEGRTVLNSLSVNDLLGKGVSKEEKSLPAGTLVHPRRTESIYTFRLPQGEAKVTIKAIATGDESSDDQRLIVMFALNTTASMNATLRLTLPFTGRAEAMEGGVMLAPQSGDAVLAASILPLPSAVVVDKGKLVITSAPRATTPSGETAVVWIVINSVSTLSATDARTQVENEMKANAALDGQPRLVVVNTADKEKLQQSDTASYTIICANIGMGEATNVVLNNPIPNGMRYVEGSATSTGTLFTAERKNAAQANLRWTLSQPLKPGEEKIVSFKVVMQ